MLPTTIVSKGKTIILHPKAYPDLNWAESTMLARLAVLTSNGTKPCVYTTKNAIEEFGVSDKTARRIFKSLQDRAYITTAKVNDLHFGSNVRQITVDPAKLNQGADSAPGEQAAPKPEAKPTAAPTPVKPRPAPVLTPAVINPDIAAAMASPMAGSQPLVMPANWQKFRVKLWDIVWEDCMVGNYTALVNYCNDFSNAAFLAMREDAPHLRASCGFILDHMGGKRLQGRTDAQAAIAFFVYHLTTKFLQEHMQCPEGDVSLQTLLRQEAAEYVNGFCAAAKDKEQSPAELATKVMTDLEFSPELVTDQRMIDLLAQHLIPQLLDPFFFVRDDLPQYLGRRGMYYPSSRAVYALDEPRSVPSFDVLRQKLLRKRELVTFAPAPGVDPRGTPAYLPFTNTTVFDLGPALDQTKFGRFVCYDVDGKQHDFKFDFSGLDHLLSWDYRDHVSTPGNNYWDPHFTTCFDSDPCVAKAIHDYILFAIVTELIAPITAENVFYNMAQHQDGNLLELFQAPQAHRSLLMHVCDIAYPDEDDGMHEIMDSRPVYNYIRNNYTAGPKSKLDYAAFVVANQVVRLLGDPEESAKIFKVLKGNLHFLGRSAWMSHFQEAPYATLFAGLYTQDLRTLVEPHIEMPFVPRLTYPLLLMRELKAIQRVRPDRRLPVGYTFIYGLLTHPVAMRDLALLKATYAADYPFLNQMSDENEDGLTN